MEGTFTVKDIMGFCGNDVGIKGAKNPDAVVTFDKSSCDLLHTLTELAQHKEISALTTEVTFSGSSVTGIHSPYQREQKVIKTAAKEASKLVH